MPKNIAEIQADLQKLQAQGKSLRWIAENYFGGKVNHAVVQRALKGIEPQTLDVRDAIGLQRVSYIRQVRNPKGQFTK